MIDAFLKYILGFVYFMRRNVYLVVVNLMVIGINIIVAVCLSRFRQKTKQQKPRRPFQPIKPGYYFKRRHILARRQMRISATRVRVFTPPSDLIQHHATDDEDETLDEVDSLSSNSSEMKVAIGAESLSQMKHDHTHKLKVKAETVDFPDSKQKRLQRFALRAGLLKREVHGGKYSTNLRRNDQEIYKQALLSDRRKLRKESENGDISITEKSTNSECQRPQPTSSLRDRCFPARKPSQRPKNCPSFLVANGRRKRSNLGRVTQGMSDPCNDLEIYKQALLSDRRKFRKGSENGDISITEKLTNSECQRPQPTSSLRDRCFPTRNGPKNCPLFLVTNGRRKRSNLGRVTQGMPGSCIGGNPACQSLFDNQSDSTLVSKQDSCIWFTTDHRSGLETFSERQRKFQSADPRVARLAVEIHRQEIMNEVIKRKALSLSETPACKSGLVESGSQTKVLKNATQTSYRTNSSQLGQVENTHRPKRVFKNGNSQIQTCRSFIAMRSPRRLKTHMSTSETNATWVKEQEREESVIKAGTPNAEKRATRSSGPIFHQPVQKEKILWPVVGVRGNMSKRCLSWDKIGKRESAAPRAFQKRPLEFDQGDKKRSATDTLPKHDSRTCPDMEVQLQNESKRPPSVPGYNRSENGSYLAVSLPVSQVSDKRPLWITTQSFAPDNSRSQRYLDHRIEGVQKEIGLEVAKTIHSLLFDTEISSSHSTSKTHIKASRVRDEHGEYVKTKSRLLQHINTNNAEDERYKLSDTTDSDAKQLGFYNKVTPKQNSRDKVTTPSSFSTRQAKTLEQRSQNNSVSREHQLQREYHRSGFNSRPTTNSRDFKGRRTFQMARGNSRIGAMKRCGSQDEASQLIRPDHSSSNIMVTELQERSIPKNQTGNRIRVRSCDFDDNDNGVRTGDPKLPYSEESSSDFGSCPDSPEATARYEICCSKSKHDLRTPTSSHDVDTTTGTTATTTTTTAASSSRVISGNIPMKYVSAENECNLVDVDSQSHPKAMRVQTANSEDQLKCLSLDQQSLLSYDDGGPSCEAREADSSYNLLLNQWYDDISSTSSDGQGQICFMASYAP